MEWLEARESCAHEPNARGTACQHCGIPAEMVPPDELEAALSAEIERARLAAGGQTSWLDGSREVIPGYGHRHGDAVCYRAHDLR